MVCHSVARPPWPELPWPGPRASDGWLARVRRREMRGDGYAFRWAVAMPHILGPDVHEPAWLLQLQVYACVNNLFLQYTFIKDFIITLLYNPSYNICIYLRYIHTHTILLLLLLCYIPIISYRYCWKLELDKSEFTFQWRHKRCWRR